MLVEVVLDLLVRDVYTQLLKRVTLKVLEPKDVQDSDGETLITDERKAKSSLLIWLVYR